MGTICPVQSHTLLPAIQGTAGGREAMLASTVVKKKKNGLVKKIIFFVLFKIALGDYLANCRRRSPVHQISNHCLFSNASILGSVQKVEGLRRGSSS